jgi:hypothetical protein
LALKKPKTLATRAMYMSVFVIMMESIVKSDCVTNKTWKCDYSEELIMIAAMNALW